MGEVQEDKIGQKSVIQNALLGFGVTLALYVFLCAFFEYLAGLAQQTPSVSPITTVPLFYSQQFIVLFSVLLGSFVSGLRNKSKKLALLSGVYGFAFFMLFTSSVGGLVAFLGLFSSPLASVFGWIAVAYLSLGLYFLAFFFMLVALGVSAIGSALGYLASKHIGSAL